MEALNYLAKRLDGMDELECKQFFAALTCDEVNIGWGLKSLINLTFNLDRFTLIEDASDLEKVGRTHMLNIRGGIATSEFENKEWLFCQYPLTQFSQKVRVKGFQLIDRKIFRFASAQIEQLLLHPRPHAFATDVIMAFPAGAVHALDYSETRDRTAKFFACAPTSAIRMEDRAAHFPKALAGAFYGLDT
ncbi:MAG: hypothetical protein NC084_08020 [Bacteroides sp.]|nr:hypothetical protein [Bacteroides sp.]